MGKKLLVVVAALVASTALSGCWILREQNWTVDKPKPGEKTTLKVGLMPTGGGQSDRFFLGFVFKGGGMNFGPAKFDSTGELGRPKKMVRDPALLTALGDFGVCDEVLPLAGAPGTLFRTRGNVSSDTRKFVQATMRAKARRQGEGGGAFGFVFTGAWEDDGDGIPEDPATTDDDLECTGASTTAVFVRGGSPARADLRELLP